MHFCDAETARQDRLVVVVGSVASLDQFCRLDDRACDHRDRSLVDAMIETLTILLLGAYAQGWGFDPFWCAAAVVFCAVLFSRLVRVLVHWHRDR